MNFLVEQKTVIHVFLIVTSEQRLNKNFSLNFEEYRQETVSRVHKEEILKTLTKNCQQI